MGDSGKRKAGKASGGQVSSETQRAPKGTVLPVTDIVDLSYLCFKILSAEIKHKVSVNNRRLMQRQVSWWIREDAEFSKYQFLYCGEVGFDMTKAVPTPIMSRNEPYRPSVMPISVYREIYQDYVKENQLYFNFISFEVLEPVSSLEDLEELISIYKLEEMRGGKANEVGLPSGYTPKNLRGTIRIPDVIRKKDPTLTGEKGYHPDNISTVIEIKFPGDSLSPKQRRAYFRIAGEESKFRLLTAEDCRRRRNRGKEEEELQKAKSDPVYTYVGDRAMRNPVLAYKKSLEGQLEEEYEKVRVYIADKKRQMESRPTTLMMPMPDTRAQDRARAQIEMSLAAPWVAVGGLLLTGYASPVIVTGISEGTVYRVAATKVIEVPATLETGFIMGRPSAQILQFVGRTRATKAITIGAAGGAKLAAAEDRSESILDSYLDDGYQTLTWLDSEKSMMDLLNNAGSANGVYVRYYVYWID